MMGISAENFYAKIWITIIIDHTKSQRYEFHTKSQRYELLKGLQNNTEVPKYFTLIVCISKLIWHQINILLGNIMEVRLFCIIGVVLLLFGLTRILCDIEKTNKKHFDQAPF